jgi:4-hydroxybenzoate polyprenyltransferase
VTAPALGFWRRLWLYQAERFPLFKHGLLITIFAGAGVTLGAMLADAGRWPTPAEALTAIFVCIAFFAQLRIADEHKDFADDSRYRPERPVPRGLITLQELRRIGLVLALLQFALTAWLHPPLLGLLLLTWGWMALMTAEFFVPEWLKARPILYLVSHMLIMPLIAAYALCSGLLPAGGAGGAALIAFCALAFFNGAALEIARKSWAPDQEREGVETYTRLWGPRRAGLATTALALLALAAFAAISFTAQATQVGAVYGLAIAGAATLFAALAALRFGETPTPARSKGLETSVGFAVLASYMAVGVLAAATVFRPA